MREYYVAFFKNKNRLNPCSILIELLLKCLCNKPYSFLQIILAGIKVIAKGSIYWLPGVKPNLSKYLICTEFAGIFMQEACGSRFDQSPELLTLEEVESIALGITGLGKT